jgi:recombinational DNA repair protein RecR
VDRVTLIGVGIPAGSDLEYAEEAARMKAMDSRCDL